LLIGIDVGGTFTDGVLFNGNEIVNSVKKPTNEENLKETLLQVLDELLQTADIADIKRIVFSTTLVTNLLATGRGEKTALVLLPGYGLPHNAYDISSETYFLKGSIDFRGREIERLDNKEIGELIEMIKSSGIKRAAVASKFSNRNNIHEKIIKQKILEECDDVSVSISSEVSGKLNFLRRAATAYFTAMTLTEWNRFVDEIEEALQIREIDTDVHILKADGGTMPLQASRDKPCETAFSGPAASTMGAVALTRDGLNSVVVDIGGTTTDLSLIIAGEPLYASKGASIEGKLTHINSFAVRSIALGGDSVITSKGVQPYRMGPAACFGGEKPTVTDAFNFHLKLNIGDSSLSELKMSEAAAQENMKTAELCATIVHSVINKLHEIITEMFRQWENEPAYKVWEVISKREFTLDRIIGIGAAAHAMVPALAEKMNVSSFIHSYSPVANALGASVVRPTLSVVMHVDTQKNLYTVDPGGISGELEKPRSFQMTDAKEMAKQYLVNIGKTMGLEKYTDEYSFFIEEQFNMIRGWDRVGKLFEVGIQVSPGFIDEFKGVEI